VCLSLTTERWLKRNSVLDGIIATLQTQHSLHCLHIRKHLQLHCLHIRKYLQRQQFLPTALADFHQKRGVPGMVATSSPARA